MSKNDQPDMNLEKMLPKSFLQRFALDAEKVEKGVPVDIGGVEFMVAYPSSSNKRYIEAIRKHAHLYNTGRPEDEEEAKIKTFSEGILTGWNLTDDKGKPVPYTPEAGEKMIREFPDFFTQLQMHAENVGSYQRQSAEQAAKN